MHCVQPAKVKVDADHLDSTCSELSYIGIGSKGGGGGGYLPRNELIVGAMLHITGIMN